MAMARTGTRRPVLGVVVGTRRIRDRAFLIADGVPMWGRGFPPTGFGVPAAVPLIIPSLLIGEAPRAGGGIRNLLCATGVRPPERIEQLPAVPRGHKLLPAAEAGGNVRPLPPGHVLARPG